MINRIVIFMTNSTSATWLPMNVWKLRMIFKLRCFHCQVSKSEVKQNTNYLKYFICHFPDPTPTLTQFGVFVRRIPTILLFCHILCCLKELWQKYQIHRLWSEPKRSPSGIIGRRILAFHLIVKSCKMEANFIPSHQNWNVHFHFEKPKTSLCTNEYSFIETYWRQLVASRLNRSVIWRSQVRQPTVGCGACL